ncbi:MAG: hypothetical protein HQ510_06730 [Candidatus Marinimicrobia bacterium]|nr:hypothetical protein [Candidatus Neomarinimicrobiota bacterium]
MDINDTNYFLKGLHLKIKKKKKMRFGRTSVLLVLLATTISVQSTKMIYETKLDELWMSIPSFSMTYEWENIEEIGEMESLEYLIDAMELDELVEFIDEEYDAATWLKSIKLEG